VTQAETFAGKCCPRCGGVEFAVGLESRYDGAGDKDDRIVYECISCGNRASYWHLAAR
jgi:hypothetical protein